MEKEIIQGNKLIAHFMDEYDLFHWERDPFNEYRKADYHSNWENLMPVVEKIEQIKDNYHGRFGVYIGSNTCTIQSTKFRSDKKIPKPPYYFNCVTLDTKINSTYLMVVRFIKWYNTNKVESAKEVTQ
jgi:hypothetical protein